MTLPSSGPISAYDVNNELAKFFNDPLTLNDLDVRALAQRLSGQISLSDLYNGFCQTYSMQVGISGGASGYNSAFPMGSLNPGTFQNAVVRAMYFSGSTFLLSLAAFQATPDSFYGILLPSAPGSGPVTLLRSLDASLTTGTDGFWNVYLYSWSGVTNLWSGQGGQFISPQMVKKV